METIEYATDGWLTRVDDTVLEVFSQSELGSLRLSLRFAAVSLETLKTAASDFARDLRLTRRPRFAPVHAWSPVALG